MWSLRPGPGPVGGRRRRGDLPTDLPGGRRETARVRVGPLGRGVNVFGLGEAGQLVLVARQAAEQDGAADAEDGGAPAEAVRPGVVIVALVDQLVELHGVNDEGDDLEDHCGEKKSTFSLLSLTTAMPVRSVTVATTPLPNRNVSTFVQFY